MRLPMFRFATALLVLQAAFASALPYRVLAALGDCGQPASTGAAPTASDALSILLTAVGAKTCAPKTCDVDANCLINATDALRVLRKAVGIPIEINCNGDCGVTTTSTSTSFTTTSSTTSTTLFVGPVWPADPADYVTGPISYLNALTIPSVTGSVASCCRDFGEISKNGPGVIDNALAVLANTLLAFQIDFGAILTQSLEAGSLVVVLDHQLLDFAPAVAVTEASAHAALRRALPDDFALVQLDGAFDVGTTYTEASAGSGSFLVRRSSFVPGTGRPENFSYPALMDTDSMSASGLTLNLTLPFGFLTLDLRAFDATVTADHGTITAAGVPYTNGEISGYVLVDDIFAGLNGLLNSPQCACLGLASDVYSKQPNGTWSGSCVGNALDVCSQPEEEVCVTLAGNVNSNPQVGPVQACGILPAVLTTQADIDLNGDPSVYEGLSLGLQFTGVTGQVSGIEP